MFKKTSFLKGCKDKVSSNRSVEWALSDGFIAFP